MLSFEPIFDQIEVVNHLLAQGHILQEPDMMVVVNMTVSLELGSKQAVQVVEA